MPSPEPIRVWHLLTHTAGLTYGFHHAHPIDEMYRAAGFEWGAPAGLDLAGCVDAWAQMPLVFTPRAPSGTTATPPTCSAGSSRSSPGQPLDAFLDEDDPRAAGHDGDRASPPTTRRAPRPSTPALADGSRVRADALRAPRSSSPPTWLSGGGGLVSTAADYHRFTQMLLRRRRARRRPHPRRRAPCAYMGRNHLPGGADLTEVGRPLFAEMPFDGVGFGLGFSVVARPGRATGRRAARARWPGAARRAPRSGSTRVEEITALFFTQLMPSSAYPIRSSLRRLVYQALVDETAPGGLTAPS